MQANGYFPHGQKSSSDQYTSHFGRDFLIEDAGSYGEESGGDRYASEYPVSFDHFRRGLLFRFFGRGVVRCSFCHSFWEGLRRGYRSAVKVKPVACFHPGIKPCYQYTAILDYPEPLDVKQ